MKDDKLERLVIDCTFLRHFKRVSTLLAITRSCLGKYEGRVDQMEEQNETLPTLPLRLFAPNPLDSLPPGVSLSPFRGSASRYPGLTAQGTVHTATTSTQGVTVSVRMAKNPRH